MNGSARNDGTSTQSPRAFSLACGQGVTVGGLFGGESLIHEICLLAF